MTRCPLHARLQAIRRRFRGDRYGVSAVEFAMLLPVMMLLFFGSIEVSDALTAKRKVTHVTSTLSDLITQSKTVSTAEMNDILAAAAAIMTPYPQSKLKIKLTGVTIDDNSKAKVAWGAAYNDTPAIKNTNITLPTSVIAPNTFIVTGEVHYEHTPTIGYVMTGTFDLSDQFYLRPRTGTAVEYPG